MQSPPLKILLVDDTKINLLILEDLVRSMGHLSISVESGEAALASIEDSQPDLILLDIILPGLDGYEVLQKLKKSPLHCGIPVVMISSLGDTESVVKCIQLGADDYVTKPFTLPLLKARITSVMEKRQASLKADQLGRYTLEKKIGEGGMAEVYLAHHALLRRPTAVKVLKRKMLNEENLSLFEREVQITSKLTHPNTIVIFDYGRTPDGFFYYAMEYLDGISLQSLVEQNGPVPEERVIQILKQVCGSLAEAHANGLIHRDIKPANIMLCNRGGEYDVVQVLDFGIVQSMSEKEQAAQEDYVLGTPAYMPPESLQSGTELDGRSDLYSLALVAYFLLTGKDPFNKGSLEKTIEAQINEAPVSLSIILGEKISPDFDHLILKCLEKEMENRPPNARNLRASLEQCQHPHDWTRSQAEKWWDQQAAHSASLDTAAPLSDNSPRTLSIDLLSPRTQPMPGRPTGSDRL
ncbi:MAG: protein kinase [Verrucomicrobiota bacterium]